MRIYKPVAIVLLLAQAGCYTTRTLESPAQLTGARTGRVFVTTTSGGEVVIASARVIDDTIFGFDKDGKQTAMSFRDAKVVRVREVSNTKTIALTAAVLVAAVAVAVLVKGKGAGLPPGGTTTDCDKHPDAIECQPK